MRRSALALPLLLVGSAVALAPAGSGAAEPAVQGTKVVLEDVSFKRALTSVRVGQRVTWVWNDGQYVPHNVRSVGQRRFRGSTTKTEGTHSVRFTRGGRYRYACTIHKGMDGTIVVR